MRLSCRSYGLSRQRETSGNVSNRNCACEAIKTRNCQLKNLNAHTGATCPAETRNKIKRWLKKFYTTETR